MKLWSKGYDLDAEIERYTVGDDPQLDLALAAYDCTASAAHAVVLERAGVLTTDERVRLCAALDTLRAEAEAGEFEIRRADEDCHTAIERRLTDALGELGKKIHTARSRNDQVVAALRLYARDRIDGIEELIAALVEALERRIGADGEVAIPGYTHMRKAMPSSISLWLGAVVSGLIDDRVMLEAARRLIDQNPLGSAAGFGVPVLEIDRELSARELGFARVQRNALAVQNSRGKYEACVVSALANVTGDLNRLSSDLILFSMDELGFVRLPREICTGSSIMPQKLNPDALELMRARHHELLAAELQIRGQTANLISGYHRDVQRTKRPLMESFETTASSLRIMARVIERIEIDREACARGCTDELQATRRAYEMVRDGVPFRDAYRRVAEELFGAGGETG